MRTGSPCTASKSHMFQHLGGRNWDCSCADPVFPDDICSCHCRMQWSQVLLALCRSLPEALRMRHSDNFFRVLQQAGPLPLLLLSSGCCMPDAKPNVAWNCCSQICVQYVLWFYCNLQCCCDISACLLYADGIKECASCEPR